MWQFFAIIKKYEQFNPMLKAIKDKNDKILLEPQTKVSRWQEYFEELLNGDMPETPIPDRMSRVLKLVKS